MVRRWLFLALLICLSIPTGAASAAPTFLFPSAGSTYCAHGQTNPGCGTFFFDTCDHIVQTFCAGGLTNATCSTWTFQVRGVGGCAPHCGGNACFEALINGQVVDTFNLAVHCACQFGPCCVTLTPSGYNIPCCTGHYTLEFLETTSVFIGGGSFQFPTTGQVVFNANGATAPELDARAAALPVAAVLAILAVVVERRKRV